MKLQIQLSGAAERLLDELSEGLGVKPREVVLDALALYHFALEQVREGKRIGSVDPKNKEFTAIATPTLQAASAETAARQQMVQG